MELTKDQLAYGQQKNREYAWNQAKDEARDFFCMLPNMSNEQKEEWLNARYEELCEQANITPF